MAIPVWLQVGTTIMIGLLLSPRSTYHMPLPVGRLLIKVASISNYSMQKNQQIY